MRNQKFNVNLWSEVNLDFTLDQTVIKDMFFLCPVAGYKMEIITGHADSACVEWMPESDHGATDFLVLLFFQLSECLLPLISSGK